MNRYTLAGALALMGAQAHARYEDALVLSDENGLSLAFSDGAQLALYVLIPLGLLTWATWKSAGLWPRLVRVSMLAGLVAALLKPALLLVFPAGLALGLFAWPLYVGARALLARK